MFRRALECRSMLIVERQQKILHILRDRKAAQLEELASALNVSVSTVRRDIESFEAQGIAKRTHGGAIYMGTPALPTKVQGHTLNERMDEQVQQKIAIGKAAAALVEPLMTVLLDGGSTVVYAARQITARPIQVVTNSLAIAHLFYDDEQVETLLIGGNLYPRIGVTIGPLATGCLADLHADLLLFSLAGILGDSAYNINMAMVDVEQTMMRQATRCALLMDSGKFDRKSLARVCGLDEVDQIISDSGISQTWRDQLGDQLIVTP